MGLCLSVSFHSVVVTLYIAALVMSLRCCCCGRKCMIRRYVRRCSSLSRGVCTFFRHGPGAVYIYMLSYCITRRSPLFLVMVPAVCLRKEGKRRKELRRFVPCLDWVTSSIICSTTLLLYVLCFSYIHIILAGRVCYVLSVIRSIRRCSIKR